MLRAVIQKAREWASPRYVRHQGVRLPPARLRFCGPEFKDDGYFLASARAEADRLVAECGLTALSRVLDVGCGPGRLAIGIASRLGAVAEYRGLDVHLPSIRWCTRHVARLNPAFRFQHLDVKNARYNPDGTVAADGARLPLPDAHFDVVYLYSVFSHMLADDVRGYLGELRRVTSPGGRLFLTGFLEEGVAEVSENPAGYGQAWTGPLHCVRYERGAFQRMLRDAGFEVTKVVHGRETDGQSAVYARRR
jgi:SAM-dependent methyltransferase